MTRTYPLTPRRLALLMLRLIALFFLITTLTSIGYILFPDGREADWKELPWGPYTAGLVFNSIIVILLFAYSNTISRILARGLPKSPAQSRWTRTELLSVVIAGVSTYLILAGAPVLLNQLFSLLTLRLEMAQSGYSDPARVSSLFSNLLGSVLRVGIAFACFFCSSKLATLWDRFQIRNVKNAFSRTAL
jgi:hypothetical protein